MEPHDELFAALRRLEHTPSGRSERAVMEAFDLRRQRRRWRRRIVGGLAVAAMLAVAFVGGRRSVDHGAETDAVDVVSVEDATGVIAWAPAASDLTATPVPAARGVPPRN